MRQDEELWMKKMKEVLGDYSEPPAPDGWSRLEKGIVPVQERRTRLYIQWIAVAAALLVAVSGISLFFMHSPAVDDIRNAATPVLTSSPSVMPESQQPDVLASQTTLSNAGVNFSTTSAYSIRNKGKQSQRIVAMEDLTDYGFDSAVVTEEKEEVAGGDVVPQDASATDADAKSAVVERQPIKPSGKDKLHIPVATTQSRASRGKWSVGASVSNMPSTTSTENHDYLLALSTPQNDGLSLGMIEISSDKELVFEEGLPYLKQKATVKEMKHKQPVSVGLTVRKGLGNGFSVESGVMYTLLSSDGKMEDNPSKKIEQKLHYIGLPVRGNWNFVDSKLFTSYISAGVMVEKCVYGKIGSEKHTVDELQFSVSSGVGVQVNVSNRVGIYVEPGISYFFDDGSNIETIRKENKLNFNLQVGIRLTY